MAAHDMAAGDQVRRLAGQPRLPHLGPDDHDPHVLVTVRDLHGQVGDAHRLRNAAHRLDRPLTVAGQAGRFGIGAKCILLHHPQVCPAVVEQRLGIIDHAAIDAGHRQRDADEQAKPDTCQHEFAPAMQDVTAGKADHGRLSTMLNRLLAFSAFAL